MKTGGCLCGAVRYEISAEPVFVGGCYCRDCQKETGTGHNVVAGVPSQAFKVSGPTKTYTRKGGSGMDITRTFCSECGSTVFSQPQVMAGMTMLRMGTLDEPAGYQLNMNIYCSRAQAWDQPAAGVTAHATAPTYG